MTTKIEKTEILNRYVAEARALAPEAQKAFGSRATASHNHKVSKEFTTLMVKYVEEGGSLIKMAEALNMTYPALRRRVMTANVTPLPRSTRSKAPAYEYTRAASHLNTLKKVSTISYHDAIKEEYDRGLSLNKLATYMGLKSAYPLYYGLNNARMRQQ